MEFFFRPREVEVAGRRRVFQVLVHPGSVAILAVREGRVALVRQLRPATGEWLWEIPAGTLNPGEPPEQAAARELEEETGWRAGSVQELAAFYLAPGYSSELMHLMLAGDLTRSRLRLDEGEFIDRVAWVTPQELTDMARRGQLRDAKSLAALWWLNQLPAPLSTAKVGPQPTPAGDAGRGGQAPAHREIEGKTPQARL